MKAAYEILKNERVTYLIERTYGYKNYHRQDIAEVRRDTRREESRNKGKDLERYFKSSREENERKEG